MVSPQDQQRDPDFSEQGTSRSRDRESSSRRLTTDELIAVVVAFLGIGGIFTWALSQNQAGVSLNSLTNLSPSTQVAKLPFASPAPSPIADQKIGTIPSKPSAAVPATDLSAQTNPQIPPPTSPRTGTQTSVQASVQASAQPGASDAAATRSDKPAETKASPAPKPPAAEPKVQASAPPAAVPSTFSDVSSTYWASPYIAELARRNILDGQTDGTYRPDQPITRAEFAEMLNKAFDKPSVRQGMNFKDLPDQYWARKSIDKMVETGFLNGYPGEVFQPNQLIPIFELQLALVNGLKLQTKVPAKQTLARYEDANTIPKWAQDKLAAATEAGLVTKNAFGSKKLEPRRSATRADAAAAIYQALMREKPAK